MTNSVTHSSVLLACLARYFPFQNVSLVISLSVMNSFGGTISAFCVVITTVVKFALLLVIWVLLLVARCYV